MSCYFDLTTSIATPVVAVLITTLKNYVTRRCLKLPLKKLADKLSYFVGC